MLKKRLTVIIIAFSLIFSSGISHARYHPGIKWRTVRNDNFTIYYPEGYEAFARRVMSISDEVHSDVTGYLDVSPRRVSVVLNPFTDLFNGFYSPFPNRISLFETPVSELKGFGSSLDDLTDLVYTHEYSHFAHITTRRGLFGFLTRIFGDGLASTNGISPGWIIEGVTTNLETRFTTGGRGRSSLFRNCVLDFARSGDLWGMSASGTESPYGPPQGRIYHSGLYMVEYLNKTYGDDAFARLSKYQAAHPLRGSGRALKHVTGKSHRAFYREYSEHVASIADSLERAVESKGLPSGKTVFPSGLDGCVSHFWTGRGTVSALRKGYGSKTALVEIDPVSGGIIAEIPTGTMLNHTPVRNLPDGRLVFGGVFFHPLGGGEIDVSDLVVFDPATGHHERLTRNAHIFSADLSPDGSVFAAVRRNGMWSELVLIDRDGSDMRTLVSMTGFYFQSPCWSPDGETLAVTVKSGSYTDIALVNPVNGEINLLFAPDVYGDGDPSFSPDGRWLVFSSSRDGVWNIHAWDLTDKRLYRLTSVFTAALEPRVSPDCGTLSFLVRSKTLNEIRVLPFEPHRGREIDVDVAGKLPEPEISRIAPGGDIADDDVPYLEAYKPFIHMPVPGQDESGVAAGLIFVGGDPVQDNFYTTQFLYGLESNRPAYDVTLTNASFWPVIDARVYDTADKGDKPGWSKKYWYRKRGGELSVNLDFIHRVVPSNVLSDIAAGVRFSKYSSLDDTVAIESDRDFSGSVFGEFRISRIPDFAPRDMVPGWGQYFSIFREEGVEFLGNELPGHSQVIIARQYIPSFIKHHGLEFTLFHRHRSSRHRYYSNGIIPRGYDDDVEAGGFNLKKMLCFSLEYRFPLLYTDRGLGVNLIHFNRIRGSFYVDHGAGWKGTFHAGDWGRAARTSVGATLTAGFKAFSFVPVEFGVGAGYKIREKEGFAYIILETPIYNYSGLKHLRTVRLLEPARRLLNRNCGLLIR